MEKLRQNDQRAKIAIMVIWMVMAIEILTVISGYLQYNLIQKVANGGEITLDEANLNDRREQLIAIVHLILLVICGITFIQWFRRAYFNLHLKVKNLLHSEGWAAGAWFVPFLNLYRPFQIMREIYEETKKLLIKNGIKVDENFSTNAVGWWWGLYLTSNFLGNISYRLSKNATTVDALNTSTVFHIIVSLLGIPVAILATKVIRDYSRIEPLLHELEDKEEAIPFETEIG